MSTPCPSCTNSQLHTTALADQLPAEACPDCRGAILSLIHYRDWRAAHAAPEGAVAALLRGEISPHLWNKVFPRHDLVATDFSARRIGEDLATLVRVFHVHPRVRRAALPADIARWRDRHAPRPRLQSSPGGRTPRDRSGRQLA